MRRHSFRSNPRITLSVIAVASAAAVAAGPVPVAAQAPVDTSLFGGLSFRNVGPVRGGRSQAVAGSVARPHEYYFGATGGGVFKTTDGGLTWNPVTDKQINSSSVGAIAVCEKNPDVVYVGMGETELRGNIMQGDGVYRSTDAGKTWKHVGLTETQAISRVRIDPKNCDRVYVAALGHPYGPNSERGIFRSTNGGQSWEKVLYRSDHTGASDLVIDPKHSNTLYAAFWQVYRTSWSLESGGTEGGIFKSTDGGTHWKELTHARGLPTGLWGKVGVSVSGADSKRVYAIVEADSGGLFRSDDGGNSWTKTNDERKLRQRAFYYSRVYADPIARDIVYVLNTSILKSTDAGMTFPRAVPDPHGDNHDLWIAPNDNQRMINANDGSANVSINAGASWTDQDVPTAQLYHIIATNHNPYWVCGSQQDNGTACMPSRNTGVFADIIGVGGGESGYIASDPDNPNIFYAGNYGGDLSRFDAATGEYRSINVWPDNPMGYSSIDIRERFQWTYPIVFSRTGPKKLYVGSQHLWVTTNEGQSWTRISPDLTRHDPKTMQASGGPITKDQTGVETYATIFTIAPSPHDANTIWTGSDDGFVQVTRDGGATWTNVTPKDMPDFSRISLIEVSPHDAATAYVAAKRYQSDDRAPYIYRTRDYGRTWDRIVNGIAPNDFVHAVREDTKRRGLLWAGTEHGMYISFDSGDHWQPFNRNLPDLQVADIMVKDNDLVIATHGRSAYVMNNIGPLRELSNAVASQPVHVFTPTDPIRGEDQLTLTYFLKQPAKRLAIDILDAKGAIVRSFIAGDTAAANALVAAGGGRSAAPPMRAGTNRFTWDLRYPGPMTFPNLIMWGAGTQGPLALPGAYQARIRADSMQPQIVAFNIRKDPAHPELTDADYAAQFELAMKVRDATTAANEGVITIRDVKSQVDDRVKKSATLRPDADTLARKLSTVEEALYQVKLRSGQDPLNYPIRLNNRIAALLGAVEGVPGRPTQQTYEVFDLLSRELEVQRTALRTIIEKDLADFNRKLIAAGLQPVVVKQKTIM
jgi:photosystem II stability/assembly factor-like uncharacterized protein